LNPGRVSFLLEHPTYIGKGGLEITTLKKLSKIKLTDAFEIAISEPLTVQGLILVLLQYLSLKGRRAAPN